MSSRTASNETVSKTEKLNLHEEFHSSGLARAKWQSTTLGQHRGGTCPSCKTGVVALSCYPSIPEVEAEGSRVPGKPRLHSKTLQQNPGIGVQLNGRASV